LNGDRTPTDPFTYPTHDEIENIHRFIIQQRGVNGWMSKGMVDACIEFARTDTHKIIPFPTFCTRASAILYAFIAFHPYADGNKRTALVVTSFFCFMNGYALNISDDAPDFTKSVAVRCLDTAEHSAGEEVKRIMEWLLPNLSQGRIMRLFHHLSHRRQRSLAAKTIWVIGFTVWNEAALARMRELRREKHPSNFDREENPTTT